MAEEEKTETELSPEEANIKRIGLNRVFLIVSLVVTLLVAILSSVTVYMMASKIPDFDSQANNEENLIQRINDLEQSLARLSRYKSEELGKIQDVSDQAKILQEQCSAGLSPELLAAMQQREKDFQKLIIAVQTSTTELAMMTRGSREWLVSHKAALQALQKDSIDRAVNFEYIEK